MAKKRKHRFTLNNCLFGSVELFQNTELDKYKHSGYCIWFDPRSDLGFDSRSRSFRDRSVGKNCNYSGDRFAHIDNNNKDILSHGEGQTQWLDDTTLTAEGKYPISFTQSGKRFVLSLHYNWSNSFLFVNATKIFQFKAKDFEIKDYMLFSGNISKKFTINNLKKSRQNFFLSVIMLLTLMIF